MRKILAIVIVAAMGPIGSVVAQNEAAAPAADAVAPQAERICEQEIAEAGAMVAESGGDLDFADQDRVTRLLDEAQAFCDENNEMMAAIRLETLQAIIEITAP